MSVDQQQLQKQLTELGESLNVPGVAIGVYHNGEAWPRGNNTSARPLRSRTTSECGRWSAL